MTTSISWNCPDNSSLCLPGDKHKDFASPEDDSYAACLDYKKSSCCTSEFTKQLNKSTVTYIQDGDTIFNWTRCGPLSETCERFFIEIECMYRCDPSMIYFAGDFPSSLDRVPICGQYCDHWYDACKDDVTCATNWIFDWDYDETTGENKCKNGSECLTFEERYGSSKALCNILWSSTFNYTQETGLCLTPQYAKVNKLVTEEIFSSTCDTGDDDDGNDANQMVIGLTFVIGWIVSLMNM